MSNSQKILAFIPVYNGDEYLECVLKSIENTIFDKVFLVEGAFKVVVEDGYSPRSQDRTLEIIKDYCKSTSNIFYTQANERSQTEQFQLGLEFAKNNNMDWLFLIDSDEIWINNQLKNIIPFLQNKNLYSLRPSSFNFINDFNHYYDGQYCRIHRITPEAQWVAENQCKWPDRNLEEFRGLPTKHIMNLPKNIRFFHYSYVKRLNNFNIKNSVVRQAWWLPGQPKFTGAKNYFYQDGQYHLPEDIKIYPFTGQHPEIMQSHPYFNKTVAEINNNQ